MSKSKLKFVSLAVSLALSIGVNADEAVNLVKNGDAEAGTIDGWSTWSNLTVVADGAKSGTKCFKVTGKQEVSGMEPIPVNPEKTYELSGWFKAAGDKPSTLYFGLMPLDKNMKRIEPAHVYVIAGSDTVLAEACKKSDTLIKIKDGNKWQLFKDWGVVAFDTDPAGEFADLPNTNLSDLGITDIKKKESYWEVTLAKPCGKDYPAGTAVREQRAGYVGIFCAALGSNIPAEWTKAAGSVKGIVKGHSVTQFWPGTAFVKIMILANVNEPEGKLLIDDVQFKEASQPVK